MTNDELRALADALEPMARAPRFEDFDVPAFCAWVRACADAKPVGYVTANGLRSLRQDDATVLLYAHDYLIRPDHVALYTYPAPAAPQAEPIDPHMIVADDRFPDEQAEPSDDNEQAEPKREPNPDEVICPACNHQFRAIPENVQAQLWAKREPLSYDWIINTANEINAAIPFDADEQAELLQIVRAVERAHGIGDSDD